MATINDAVRQMYLTQTGREADPAGLEYFVNRFGSDIDPDELAIFRQMAADEVAGQDARNAARTNSGYGISPETQKLLDQMNAAVAAGQAAVAQAQAGRDASAAFANRSNVLTPEIALALSYRASTTGVPASELDYYGGPAAVSAAAKAAGFTATDEFIQNYEAANNLPSTIAAPAATTVAAPTAAPTAAPAAGNGATNAGMSIINAYQQVLGRTPNAQEIAYWTNQFGPDVDAAELSAFNTAAGPELAARTGTTTGTGTGATTGTTTGTATPAGMSITQAYQQVLGRTPNASEIAYWTSQFGPDVDAAELSNFSVAAQPERAATPTTNAAVQQMYRQVLGREPDAAGLKYFSDRFGADVDASELDIFKGMSTQEIAANAARTAGTGATTAAGMSITQAYQQVLGRTPNASEIAYWTSQFGASVDPTELSTFSVAAQPERAATPTTNSAIRQMYLSVLGREPDASGLKYFSDRFGTDVDATELGIFKGMSTQEIAANAAKNAGTGTTAGGLTRPTTPTQVTGTQLAPATTGAGFTNIYTPATIQQNAPTLAQINAASQSANPYQSLMALTPQRTLSPAYAAQAGQTAANTNLGGFNPAVYKPPAATTTTGGGLLTTVEQPGSANTSTGTGMAGINNQAALSAALSNLGATGVGQTLATSVGNQLGSLTEADIFGGGLTASGVNTGGFPEGYIDPGAYEGGLGPSAGMGGLTGPNYSDYGGMAGETGGPDTMGFGGEYAKGGKVNMKPQKYNPPGPDDGYAALDNGEYVIRKKAVKKYGANIFEQINAGKIPAQRLKSLLE